jgi:Rhodopirellula transposase DDE domain
MVSKSSARAEITAAVAVARESAGLGAAFAAGLAGVLAEAAPVLDERARRVLAGAGARQLGRGGIKVVAAAMGASADTVGKGVAELEAGLVADGRVRAKGAGRPAAERKDPGVWATLDALVDPLTRGDPMSPLRWTTKSTVKLADALTQHGHRVGPKTVARGVEGPRLQPAGQRQEGRGGPAPGPRRPVLLPERPAQRVSGRG